VSAKDDDIEFSSNGHVSSEVEPRDAGAIPTLCGEETWGTAPRVRASHRRNPVLRYSVVSQFDRNGA